MDRDIAHINEETKAAWCENWKDTPITTALTIFDYPRVQEMLSVYKKFISKTDKILEAGCGLGPWVIKLTQEGYDIVGIDYDVNSTRKIRAYGDFKVYAADVCNIPFLEETFDAYLSFGVLEHFAEGPQVALQEAYRVLTKGARAVITVPYRNVFIKLKSPLEYIKRNNTVRRFFGKPAKVYYYQRYFAPQEICDLIRETGFTIEHVGPLDHIFSLVSFSRIFRDRDSYDGENKFAVCVAGILKRILPWASADSTLIVGRKQ